MKNSPLIILFLFVISTAFFLTSSLTVRQAAAFTVRKGDDIRIQSEETIDGSLVATGSTVTINGTVLGDVYCAGKSVVIHGKIKGDVICAAQDLTITGAVDGNIRVIGQSIEIDSEIARNLMMAGQHVHIAKTAIIHGETMSAGQAFNMDGSIQKSLAVAGEQVNVNGKIGQDLYVDARQLFIGETATISGKGTYVSEKSAVVDSHATVANPLVQQTPRPEMKKNPPTRRYQFSFGRVIFSTLFLAVVGWIIARLFPTQSDRMNLQIISQPLQSVGYGLLFFVGGPIVFILLLVTILGIPLAFTWIFAWILIVMCSTAIVAGAVGNFIAVRYKTVGKKSIVIQLLIGAVLISVPSTLPVLGWLIRFVAMVLGSGALLYVLLNRKK